ncbi:tetratricopeptide repeat protein [Desulfofundulus thermobenzoicus]|uniref:Tetratricopeptide repeat protein n=1 Tax=Desulfofundulus thermobenzoicus TaxID=29376 RepID=A0A6N7IN33_9FIRM|nr:tetratricopeptide repeat protein [Desulfofundulus thermobenzoicus]
MRRRRPGRTAGRQQGRRPAAPGRSAAGAGYAAGPGGRPGRRRKEALAGRPHAGRHAPAAAGRGTGRYLLGKFTEAEQSLQAALPDNQLKGEASLWLALVKEKQGKPDEAQKLVQEAGKINKNSEAVFKQLKALEPLK